MTCPCESESCDSLDNGQESKLAEPSKSVSEKVVSLDDGLLCGPDGCAIVGCEGVACDRDLDDEDLHSCLIGKDGSVTCSMLTPDEAEKFYSGVIDDAKPVIYDN